MLHLRKLWSVRRCVRLLLRLAGSLELLLRHLEHAALKEVLALVCGHRSLNLWFRSLSSCFPVNTGPDVVSVAKVIGADN